MYLRRALAILFAVSALACLPAAAQQATAGQWQLGANLPFFPVHMHLLQSGKLIIWPGDDGISGNDPQLYDPVAGTVTQLALPGYDVFCSGHSFLPDGRLFDAGGHISNNVGLAFSTIYDPVANLWTKQADMNLGRWYPTDQVMPNGDVLVVDGDVDIATGDNPLPQVWQASSGTWRSLTSAQLVLGLYPTLSLAPNGQVFVSGSSPTTRFLDTSGTGNWTSSINHIYQGTRDYDSMAEYQPGKLLVVGGDDPATATAEVIDLTAATPAWRNTSPLHEARRQLNATMLPDGKVLVTGGTGGPGFSDPDPTVATYAAEEWDPATEQWTLLASATIPRLYHSIAILLPDARVLTTGGNGYTQSEIFSPPYLFAGPRPTITSAPTTVLNGQSLFVGTPDAANITSVAWIRAASVTHTVSMSQSFYNSSAITQVPGGINITSPNDPTMPAGFYLLFILNNGVPSVASMVHLGPPANASPVPVATSLSPSSIPNGSSPTTITVTGSSFSTNSAVQVDGLTLQTSFLSSTQLTAVIPASYLAAVGTQQISVITPAPGGGLSASIPLPITQAVIPDLTQTGTIIARILNPSGDSNPNPEVIRDGDMPPTTCIDNKRNYDTYSGGNPAPEDWIGYQYTTPQTFAQVIFQEGINFVDGGWFNTLTVQVLQNGTWVNVSNFSSTPAYPPNDGINYESYVLNFTPITGTAIRIDGAPGGTAYFTSIGELQVFGPPGNGATAIASLAPSSATAGASAFTLTVNGQNFAAGAVVQWNGSARTTTFVSATQLTASILASDVASAGTAQITVLSGSTTTAALPLNISGAATLTSLAPASATAGAAAFTLTVSGQGFTTGAAVQWNGSARTTTYVSGTQLTASILATDVATAGTVQVTVLSGGATSAALPFTINAATAATLTSLAPASATAGASAFTLTVNGQGFAAGSVVQWNGSARTTTYVSATQLTASILAADVATAGTAQVTVLSGGTTTAALPFTINAATAASLTSLSPSSATAGASAFTLTVNGQNFKAGAVVQWNGSARTTTYVSATQLTASILAADVATAGTAQVTVLSGGTTTGALPFTINAATAASLTSLAPASATAGAAAFTLTVNGQGFAAGSAVQWNGSARTTTYVSATQLTASILASDVATAGTAQVTVLSGGTTTAALPFTINAATAASLTSLAPSSATAGASAFTLTVNGQNFKAGAAVQWNGSARTTTYVSATQLTASILAADVATAGTAQVTVLSGGTTTGALPFTINGASGPPNLTQTGTIIARITAPTGGGNKNLGVIRDGDMPPVGTQDSSRQYDTYSGGAVATEDWIGYQYTAPQTFAQVVFQEGMNFSDGGWFNTLTVEVLQNGTWVNVSNFSSTPVYPPNDNINYETYVLNFTPITGTGIRIDGAPGGTAYFTSTGELQVFGPATAATLTSLAPASATAGASAFTLTVNGQGFAAGSVVQWNGSARTTTYVSATQLTASILAADVATAGTAQVTVLSGGTTTAALPFTINAATAASLTSLSPSSATAGASAFTLTVNGQNFKAGAVVQWNGSARTTTYVSATQLTASILAADVATAGTAQVTVLSGGTTTGALPFTINAATAASLTSLAPASATAGAAAFTLTVNGQGFAAGSAVQWNGSARTTTYVSATQLTASILASDVATAGTAQVTVLSGGTTTAALPFTINAATAASLTSLAPSSATAGASAFTLTVNGQNFKAGAAVQWNGSARTTTYVSATQLTASILAADVATAGTAQVTVLSGGTTTGALPFTINGASGPPNLTQTGTIIARITAPTGGGNKNLGVIRDGDMPPVGTQDSSRQYDTYSGGAVATEDWIGYQYTAPQTFAQVVFQEGMNFSDGGWFNTLTVEVLQNGTWVNVSNFSSTPVYPPNDNINYETYVLNFTPITGTGIRIDGAPGGTAYFTSTGELQVFGPATAATLTSLAPASATAGASAFTLTVNGQGFAAGSVVQWNGSARTTTYVSATQLTASILAADVATAGTAQVTVLSGGTTTAALPFTINAATAASLTSLSPSSATAGASAFTLTVNGQNFKAGAVVQWNGSARTTTYVSATQLTASILAADVATAGTAQVTVLSGGTTTGALPFTINAATAASLTSLAPASATAGAAAFTLTVNGQGFAAGSAVQWNGSARTTTYVSATQLTASILASDVATAGTAQVTVLSGGTTTAALPFTINAATAASLTSLAPSSATAGASAFTLTVNGQNFKAGAAVQWNGSARTTTYVSATQLTASILAADVATAGTAQVTVLSGGTTTGALPFTINGASGPPNLTQTGTIIARITAPTGGGNKNLGVIRDGDMPPVGTQDSSRQYDTYSGGAVATEDWIGYQYTAPQTFAQVVFQEGMNFSDGGWFNTLTVEVLQNGTWVNVSNFSSTPVYPPNDNINYETYVLNFTPITGTGIRIDGAPGGTAYFTSTGELQVFGPATAATLTSLAPASATAGASAFTLTVNGQGFAAGSVVQWNGSARTTTYVSATQLTASILAADVATAGTAQVTVLSGGTTTAALPFTINAATAASLTSLSPSSATAGASAFTLTVNGQNFKAGAVVQWNGSARTTTYVSATQLTASILAADVATAGTAQVTVLSGGTTTGALPFTINAATAASLTSLAPASATAGAAAFTLTVNGQGFAAGSAVQWNGSARTTTYVSATQLTASILASDVATAGTAQVTVLSGGTTTAALPFTINAATAASLTSLAPSSATAGASAFTLTVNGQNFKAGAAVQWNGSARTTTYVSATQLTASILAADVATAGTAQVTVLSGGTTTGALPFTINGASGPPNLTQTGTIIARITAPTGGGNKNLGVIRDGDMPPVGTQDSSRQYDTYSGGAVATEDWIGYQYTAPQTFAQVVFQEGMNFSDGGWFNTLTVEVLQNGTWVNVSNFSSTPVYPPNDNINYETYVLNFTPITGTGIRIDGAPGGTAYFTSTGELQVFGP